MNWAEQIEQWERNVIDLMFDWYLSPLFLLIGLFLMGLALVLYDGRKIMIDWLLNRNKKLFAAAFNQRDNVFDRDIIRRKLSLKYLEHKADDSPATLSELVETAPLPDGLPLRNGESLILWIHQNQKTWPDDTRKLWEFCQTIYPPYAHEVDEQIHIATLMASKFWDDWGHSYLDGRILLKHMSDQLRSNASEIVLLCFLDMAEVYQHKWNKGPGKRGLCEIAKRAKAEANKDD